MSFINFDKSSYFVRKRIKAFVFEYQARGGV